jgi:hypothetical protein
VLQKKSSSDEDRLAYGLLRINQAHTEGMLAFQEWMRLTQAWVVSVLAEKDEMLDADCSYCLIDWHAPRSA